MRRGGRLAVLRFPIPEIPRPHFPHPAWNHPDKRNPEKSIEIMDFYLQVNGAKVCTRTERALEMGCGLRVYWEADGKYNFFVQIEENGEKKWCWRNTYYQCSFEATVPNTFRLPNYENDQMPWMHDFPANTRQGMKMREVEAKIRYLQFQKDLTMSVKKNSPGKGRLISISNFEFYSFYSRGS